MKSFRCDNKNETVHLDEKTEIITHRLEHYAKRHKYTLKQYGLFVPGKRAEPDSVEIDYTFHLTKGMGIFTRKIEGTKFKIKITVFRGASHMKSFFLDETKRKIEYEGAIPDDVISMLKREGAHPKKVDHIEHFKEAA